MIFLAIEKKRWRLLKMSISSTCYTFHRSNWLRWAPPPSRSRARSLMWEIKSSPDITLICQSHTRSHFPTRDCTKNELFFEREKKKSHTFFHSRTRRRGGASRPLISGNSCRRRGRMWYTKKQFHPDIFNGWLAAGEERTESAYHLGTGVKITLECPGECDEGQT